MISALNSCHHSLCVTPVSTHWTRSNKQWVTKKGRLFHYILNCDVIVSKIIKLSYKYVIRSPMIYIKLWGKLMQREYDCIVITIYALFVIVAKRLKWIFTFLFLNHLFCCTFCCNTLLSYITHDNALRAITMLKRCSYFVLPNDTPHFSLMGEIWGVFCEFCGEKILQYIERALYLGQRRAKWLKILS